MTPEKLDLLTRIKEDTIKAMKAKNDPLKLSTQRLLLAEAEKEMKRTGVMRMTDEKMIEVISRQLKKLDKEIEAYKAVNRDTTKQQSEEAILLYWMPTQLTTEEIESKVNLAFIKLEQKQIPNVMQYLAKELKGRADMKEVIGAVKRHQEMLKK